MKLFNSRVYSPAEAAAGAIGAEGGGAPPLGGATGSDGAPLNGSGKSLSSGSDMWSGLVKDPDNLNYIKAKKWSSPEEAIKSYRELESNASKSKLQLPNENSKPEEVDAFYNQLGRPEKSDGYEFKLPEKLPESFPYEEESANKFREVAHKGRLTSEQAQGLHDWYVQEQAAQYQATLESTAKKVEGAHDSIVKSFGDPKGEQYKRGMELADRTVRELGNMIDPKNNQVLRKELIDIGAILPDGKVMAPNLIVALSKIGETLYSEDRVYSGISSAKNPWKSDSENLTLQGKFLKDDPDTARQMILGANLRPEDYGLK